MDELQEYFKTVYTTTKQLAELTLLMQGYEQGKKTAESSPFSPQTAKTDFVSNSSQIEEKPSEWQIEGLNENTRGSYVIPDKKSSKWSVLLLTEKELQKMPKKFRPDFRVGKTVAHIRQKENGVYEIRCQINKRQIAASSKLLEVAKAKFIAALNALDSERTETHGNARKTHASDFERTEMRTETAQIAVLPPETPPSVTLGTYLLKWLETVKKPVIKDITYHQYLQYFNTYIVPALGDKPMTAVKPFELQEFINNLVATDRPTVANHCKVLLAAMFDYAVIDDIITKSPMSKITMRHVEPREGVPLTREEEKRLVDDMLRKRHILLQAYVFMLYTGLRRSELASVQVIDGWVYVISAKGRKGYKVKQRAIPVSPMLEPLLPFINIEGIKQIKLNSLSTMADKMLGGHHCHELRHTFITRCQECGIRREIVSLWAGHAADSSVTSQVYTHLQTNKDIQLDEIKKFYYTIQEPKNR